MVLLVLLGGFVALLWGLGLFDEQTRASNTQLVAATLALGGGLVAASLTFVGALLKHSIDQRTLHQTQETEKRLRLETSIRAVELLTEAGEPATRTRQAGALFVLANLEQLDFALALLREIWRQRQIHPAAATWVVNRALLEGAGPAQEEATEVLWVNAEDLILDTNGWWFPQCVDEKWTTSLTVRTREHLLNALLGVIAARPCEEWDAEEVNSLVAQFEMIRVTETAAHVRNGALLVLRLLLHSSFFSDGYVIFDETSPIDTDELRDEVDRLLDEIDEADVAESVSEKSEKLRAEWTSA